MTKKKKEEIWYELLITVIGLLTIILFKTCV